MEMSIRDIDPKFLNAMREKMDSGRRKGRVGWDRHWNDTLFSENPEGTRGLLFKKLTEEVFELRDSLKAFERGSDKPEPTDEDRGRLREECADVANFAMMIADFHGCLE